MLKVTYAALVAEQVLLNHTRMEAPVARSHAEGRCPRGKMRN